MKAMQPMALRMPHLFQESRSFSHDDLRTTSSRVCSPTSPHYQPHYQNDDFRSQSPDLNLPIMNPNHEPDYFHQDRPQPQPQQLQQHHSRAQSRSSTLNTLTLPPTSPGGSGSSVETHTWVMSHLPYELDLDLFPRHTLDPLLTSATIQKITEKLSRKPLTSSLSEEHRSKNFAKVVFSIAPTPSLPGDHVPLHLRDLNELLGHDGLLGFFTRVDKYCETHFRIRDVSARGRGRYVAVGRLRKGTFRGSGASSMVSAGETRFFGPGTPTAGMGNERQSQAGIFGGASKAEVKRAFADDDAATLDGEKSSNAQFEAFKQRIQGMDMRM